MDTNHDDIKIADHIGQVNLDMKHCTSIDNEHFRTTSSITTNETISTLSSSSLFSDFEYWNRSMSTMNTDLDLIDESKSDNPLLSTSSLSESLVNAYYTRKCSPQSNDYDSNDDDSNKIDNTITTTYLIWDFATNTFIEDKSKVNDEIKQEDPVVKPKSLATNSSAAVSLASPTSSTSFSNLITTTRFLHSNSPTAYQPQVANTSNNKIKNEFISLSPSISNSRSRNNSLSSNSSTSVVSKLKSWIGGGGTNSDKKQLDTSNLTKTSNSIINNLSFNPPLSIDLTRKLKRPTNIPQLLEYNNGKIFQGSLLEDWLMSTLDDYISTSHNQSLITTANNNDITKSEHSLPGTFDATPPTSVRTSILIEVNDEDECDETRTSKAAKNKLNSESYKAAMMLNSQTNIFNEYQAISIQTNEINNSMSGSSSYSIGNKRQEANFYVQQVLTDLIALGVLEYESGFENAINKTFKSKSDYVWAKFFAIDGRFCSFFYFFFLNLVFVEFYF